VLLKRKPRSRVHAASQISICLAPHFSTFFLYDNAEHFYHCAQHLSCTTVLNTCLAPQCSTPVLYHSAQHLSCTTVLSTSLVPLCSTPVLYHSAQLFSCTTVLSTCLVQPCSTLEIVFFNLNTQKPLVGLNFITELRIIYLYSL
jgi:hypothetical protein